MSDELFNPNAVTDGLEDIATRCNNEKMTVDATGRIKFQKVWLWASHDMKAQETKYNPEVDGPPDHSAMGDKLPQSTELSGVDETREYLEIGLVYSDDPEKHLKIGTGKGNWREDEKNKKPLLRRENMLRAYVPITPFIEQKARCYVGCHLENGRFHPRVIKPECIFIYQEFWNLVSKNPSTIKDRKAHIMTVCRTQAAVEKREHPRMTAPITADELIKQTTAHPLPTTRPENLGAMLKLQWSLFEGSEDMKFIRAMIKSLEDAHSDLKYGPQTQTDGIDSFRCLDEPLADTEAVQLSKELKVTYPHMHPNVDMIKQIHAELRRPTNKGQNGGGARVGDRLPVNGTGFFLEMCQSSLNKAASASSDGAYRSSVVPVAVKWALRATDVYMRHVPEIRLPFTSDLEMGKGEQKEGTDSRVRKGHLKPGDFRKIIEGVLQVILAIDDFAKRSRDMVAEEHGAVMDNLSIRDLMNKVGDAVDRAQLQSLVEQIAALHAVLYAAKDKEIVESLKQLKTYLSDILVLTEDQHNGENN